MQRAWTLFLTLILLSAGVVAIAPTVESAALTHETSKLSAPLVGASAATIGGKTYILGGRLRDGDYSEKMFSYDLATRALTTLAEELPVGTGGEAVQGSRGRYSGTSVALGGKIYYFGGAVLMEQDINGDGTKEKVPKASRDVIELDPATGQARVLVDKLPLGAWGMSSVAYNGRAYLFGGFTFDITDLPNTGRHDWVLRWDPSGATPTVANPGARFTQMDRPLPYAVQDSAAALLGNRVLIMGGLSDHSNETNPCPTYSTRDPDTGREETRQIEVCLTKRIISFDPEQGIALGVSGELPYRAQFISAAAVAGKAYIPGALLSDGSASSSIVEVSLDRANTPVSRILVPTLPRGTFGQAVATDGETIVIAGGRYGTDRELVDDVLRLDPRATAPWAPRGATAVPIAGGVRLSWEAPSYNGDAPVTGYRVYRASAVGNESRLTETPLLSFDDTTLRPGTEYTWRITAVNVAGEGTQAARVVRSSGIETPGAVSFFQAYPDNNRVLLSWRAPTESGGSNLTGYRILRNDAILITLPPDRSEYVDSSALNGETYVYNIQAYNSKGNGALAEPQRITPAAVPATPQNIAVDVADSGAASVVRVTWFPADDVDHYLVYRGTRPGPLGTLVANLTTTAFTDDKVERGQTYFYTVVSENDAGRSPPSPQSTVSLVRTPGAPTGIVVFGQEGEIRVSWSAPEDTGDAPVAALRYYVSRSSGGSSPSIIKTDIEGTLFVDKLVTPNTPYTYSVTTLNPMPSAASDTGTASARPILNKAPVAILAIPPPPPNTVYRTGDPIEIDASNSFDPDGTIRNYKFEFGDFADPVTTTTPVVTHAYETNLTYTVTVTVTDNRGESTSSTAQVIVGEVITDKIDNGISKGSPPTPGGRGTGGNAPGSKTPAIPGPGAALLLLAGVVAAALAGARRHPRR